MKYSGAPAFRCLCLPGGLECHWPILLVLQSAYESPGPSQYSKQWFRFVVKLEILHICCALDCGSQATVWINCLTVETWSIMNCPSLFVSVARKACETISRHTEYKWTVSEKSTYFSGRSKTEGTKETTAWKAVYLIRCRDLTSKGKEASWGSQSQWFENLHCFILLKTAFLSIFLMLIVWVKINLFCIMNVT